MCFAVIPRVIHQQYWYTPPSTPSTRPLPPVQRHRAQQTIAHGYCHATITDPNVLYQHRLEPMHRLITRIYALLSSAPPAYIHCALIASNPESSYLETVHSKSVIHPEPYPMPYTLYTIPTFGHYFYSMH
jgi:hypothetical protein